MPVAGQTIRHGKNLAVLALPVAGRANEYATQEERSWSVRARLHDAAGSFVPQSAPVVLIEVTRLARVVCDNVVHAQVSAPLTIVASLEAEHTYGAAINRVGGVKLIVAEVGPGPRRPYKLARSHLQHSRL